MLALFAALALAQVPPPTLPPPHWTLHVNAQDWCTAAPGPSCALHEQSLDPRQPAKVAMPRGAPWSCSAGETKSIGGRYLRTVTCTNDGGKTGVRATGVVDASRATGAELGLDWKDAQGRHHALVLALEVAR